MTPPTNAKPWTPPLNSVAVVFASRLTTDAHARGYEAVADEMVRRAEKQPGYVGAVSARGSDGVGITVSYWRDDDAALKWKMDVEHTAARARGRAEFYAEYVVVVARVERGYSFLAPGEVSPKL